MGRSTSLWFLGLAGIYLSHALTVFLELGGDVAFLERFEMVLGPSTVAPALLVSPSLFAAGVGQADTPDGNPRMEIVRRWAVITLCAGIAYLLSAVGPETVSLLTSSFPGQPNEGATASRPPTLETARHLIPFAISALVLLSGAAGVLMGHITSPWQPLRRNAARWILGVALMASFLFPFLATTDSIAQHGTSPIWILLNPLAIPFLLTTLLAVRERHALGLRPGTWWRRADPSTLDPRSLDLIATRITGDPDSTIDPHSLTEPEREMATLATAIHRIAAPRATLSESRVQEIVTALVEASPDRSPEAARPRRSWLEPSVLGGFCTSWTCLAAGLLIVSPLGGVPTSVVSATVVGFLGSAGILLVARRFPGLASTVPT
ncbi:MAG: hypothetical protein F4022_11480 [Gemmatimonadetes bacterium]|nr:hypothetical protein [Gemmatimonadota bacterium]MYK67084.1 hypothetical protein [Gemmatimonadota bacterium]